MKKHIALSLLIFSSTFTHTMEKEFSFLNPFSWFSSSQTPNESKLIADLRANINDFENQLKLDRSKELEKTYLLPETLQLFMHIGTTKPDQFIQYCYYQKFHETEMVDFDEICTDTSLLKKYHELEINGYSALGAAMLAKEISIEEKLKFIKKLIKYNFKPTLKDIGIAELVLYDAITEHHKTLLHLLHPHSEINWSVLPHEIRNHITQYILQLLRKEFWLLPETASNDL
jgi:hypothetical protein